MKQEEVEKILKSSEYIVFNGWINPDRYGFSRTASFTVRGVNYEIEWYWNCSYLKCGEMNILFDWFNICGTWPNLFKNNLQFYGEGKTRAIIPIEEYPACNKEATNCE